jgi:predicted CXXCH cytochrome family protein
MAREPCGPQGVITEVMNTLSVKHALLISLLLAAPAAVAAPPSEEVDNCLSCHADETATLTLASGENVSIFVDRAVFEKSVHGRKLGCTGCHPAQTEVPHPELTVKDRAALAASQREACKSCHFDMYQKSLDGVHEKARAKKFVNAPGCVDCHGSHGVSNPVAPRTKVSATCSSCHADIATVFAKSVHGRALGQDNPDVPVCTDCHRSHAIVGPHSEGWRLASYETCGNCHGDKKRMAKYGLSADVLTTYLSDFHGTSASLIKGGKAPQGKVVAVCADCHGTHGIKSVKEGGAESLRANVSATCQKCHPDAGMNIQAAWLSHYAPSWKHAPLVWLVNVFYKVFIPFLIGGLCLQILLHLWRVVVNR